jgi:hypothetical protein
MYEWMAGHTPALVIRLNIDAEAAHARKPDHSMAELRDKIAVMPHLQYNDAPVVEIDATIPYEQVLESALRAIREAEQSAS